MSDNQVAIIFMASMVWFLLLLAAGFTSLAVSYGWIITIITSGAAVYGVYFAMKEARDRGHI